MFGTQPLSKFSDQRGTLALEQQHRHSTANPPTIPITSLSRTRYVVVECEQHVCVGSFEGARGASI